MSKQMTDVEKTIYENERLDSMPPQSKIGDGPLPPEDTLTTAERMRQFEQIVKETDAEYTAGLALDSLHGTLASAISDQLVDFDIEGHGQATCWLNDREIRLEFDYLKDTEGPGPATHCLQITKAEYGPTDGWATLNLTPEQDRQAVDALLSMYLKWVDARSEEGE